MNPILYFLYRVLKSLTRACLRIYYPKRYFTNRERLHFDRPAIVVSNHPNTLMDPLNAIEQVPMTVHFLANAGLFKSRFGNWFFNTFYCIPIERPEDTNGKALNNKEAFARCDEFLGKGGCLYIAPEGTSEMERHLRPLKTGTARIALSAENQKGFELGLFIQPVGLTYEAPNYFGSRLIINVGEPLRIKDYQTAYQADPHKAAKQLTKDLTDRIRTLVIDTRNEEEDRLVGHLETILRNSRPVSEPLHFSRTKTLIEQLRQWETMAPSEFQDFTGKVQAYFEKLKETRTDDAALGRPPRPLALHLIGLIIFFPLYLYGLTNNFLAAFIPVWLTRRFNVYVGYNTTVKIMTGLATFPLFYFLQTRLVYWLYDGRTALLYLLSLLPAGFFAWYFHQHQARALRFLRLRRKEEAGNALRELRQEILEKIDNIESK